MGNEQESGSSAGSLKFVELARLKSQEAVDQFRVDQNFLALAKAGVLKNPPLITELSDGHFTIWDGNTRAACFGRLGYRALLAQVVSPQQIHGGTWVLILPKGGSECLDRLKSAGFCVGRIDNAKVEFGDPQTVCVVHTARGAYGIVRNAKTSRVAATCVVTDVIAELKTGRIERVSDSAFPSLAPNLNGNYAFQFAPLAPDEVLKAVEQGERVGAGVTQWRFQERLTGVALPLGPWLMRPAEELNRACAGILAKTGRRQYLDQSVTEVEISWDLPRA